MQSVVSQMTDVQDSVRLGDVLTLQRGFDLPKKDRKPGDVPLVSSSGISDFQADSKVMPPAVITGRYGTLGRVFYLEEPCFPLNTTLWVKDFKGNHPRFCKYLLETIDYYSCSDKAAVPGVNRNHLEELLVRKPLFAEQKAIAHILGTLDDKIELNQKMNQTLEDIAKAIFKSWFVDFDPVRAKAGGRPTGLPAEISDLFPDAFEDSEIGEIPAGWEVVPFTRTFQFFSGGTPKTSIPEYWNGNIPWFSIADLNGGSPWIVRTEKSITELGLSKCSARLIEKGTTIVTARGTVGKVALAAQDMAINQSCYAMRALEGWSFGWLYLQTLALVDRLKANAHGSVFDTITRETFERFHVLMPCAAIMEIFHDTMTPLFDRILCADNENLILSELRDTLLPKLISGELRIPDAEKFLEEAGV